MPGKFPTGQIKPEQIAPGQTYNLYSYWWFQIHLGIVHHPSLTMLFQRINFTQVLSTSEVYKEADYHLQWAFTLPLIPLYQPCLHLIIFPISLYCQHYSTPLLFRKKKTFPKPPRHQSNNRHEVHNGCHRNERFLEFPSKSYDEHYLDDNVFHHNVHSPYDDYERYGREDPSGMRYSN